MTLSLRNRTCAAKTFPFLFFFLLSSAMLRSYSQSISPSVSLICTSQTFSVPSGSSSILWFADPGGIISLSPSGLNCTVTRISDGDVTLKANFILNGIGYLIPMTFHVGVPTGAGPMIGGATQGESFCQNSVINVYPINAPTGDVNWVTSIGTIAVDPLGEQAYITLPSGYTGSDPVDEWLITARSVNTCGISSTEVTVAGYVDGCFGGGGGTGTATGRTAIPGGFGSIGANSLSVYPNPAGDVVNITIPDSIDVTHATITLADIFGRPLKKLVTVAGSNTVSLSGLAAGVYLVEIYDGKRSVTIRRVIKK